MLDSKYAHRIPHARPYVNLHIAYNALATSGIWPMKVVCECLNVSLRLGASSCLVAFLIKACPGAATSNALIVHRMCYFSHSNLTLSAARNRSLFNDLYSVESVCCQIDLAFRVLQESPEFQPRAPHNNPGPIPCAPLHESSLDVPAFLFCEILSAYPTLLRTKYRVGASLPRERLRRGANRMADCIPHRPRHSGHLFMV